MSSLLFATLLAALLTPVQAADEALPANVGQPDYYGRLDMAGYPQPQLVFRKALAIDPVEADRPSLYLRVAPGQARQWRKHCRAYQACNQQVYFVQDAWYTREYVPRFAARGGAQVGPGGALHPVGSRPIVPAQTR